MSSCNTSLRSLSGTWTQSHTHTSDLTLIFKIQGFNALLRSALTRAPITLKITQNDPEILIEQTTTASIPALTERWYPPRKEGTWSEWREDEDKVFGTMKSRSRWAEDGERVEAEVECVSGGWNATQVWRMEDGRFVRDVTVEKDGEKEEGKLVYEFQG